MAYRNDVITDILSVLKIMRTKSQRSNSYRNISKLRIESIIEYAETGLGTKRYKNLNSADHCIRDALVRRLNPEIMNTATFDRYARDWLDYNSQKLRKILLRHCKFPWQREWVDDFFIQ